MWFRNVYLKSLRDFRVAILGWGVGMGLLAYVVLVSFPSLVATPAARASLVSLAGAFSWIAEPIAVDTPGGGWTSCLRMAPAKRRASCSERSWFPWISPTRTSRP